MAYTRIIHQSYNRCVQGTVRFMILLKACQRGIYLTGAGRWVFDTPTQHFFPFFFFFLDYSKKYIPQSGELAISNKDWLIFAKCIQPFFFSCIITLKEKTSANTKLSFWSIVVIFNRATGLLTSRPYMGEQRPFAHAKYSLLL